MSESNKKRRRYQITPNSISPDEEKATRGVLELFRNRGGATGSASTPPNEVIGFPSQLGAQVLRAETSEASDAGRPSFSTTDAQHDHHETPKNDAIGRPSTPDIDAQESAKRTPNLSEPGHPGIEAADAQDHFIETPSAVLIGRPAKEEQGALAPNIEKWAPSHSGDDGAKTPETQKLGAQGSEKWAKWDKNRVTDRLALRPNAELLKEFKVFCVNRNYTLTEFFELAGRKFIELDAQFSPELGAKAPLEDGRLKMLYKSRPFIINLYLAYTAAFNEVSKGSTGKWAGKWLPRDDEVGLRYNEVSPVLIELGILQTMANKGIGNGRINTFQYYTGEINAWIESAIGDAAAQGVLKYHRMKITQMLGREVDLSFLNSEE